MSSFPQNPKRRAFIGDALKLGAGSLLAGTAVSSVVRGSTIAPSSSAPSAVQSLMPARLAEKPTRVQIDHDGSGRLIPTQQQGSRFTSAEGVVETIGTSDGLAVTATCPSGLLARVVLRWEISFPSATLF